jgi:tetratricopeptide (TPR) repeat protein
VLEKLFVTEPNHPGIPHYLIHAYDKPQLALLGLPAAERYAKIAPASPHALHMPSHIFARLGMWQADIDSNLASVAATQKVLAMHMEGAAHQFHSMDFLLTAYLQIGREAEALELIHKVQSMPAREDDMWGGNNWHVYAKAEYPAVYTLELGDWSAATQLELVPNAPPFVAAFTYWARSIGDARSGKAALARSNALQIKSIHDAMIASRDSYFEDSVLQEFQEASAWADYAEGHISKATDALRQVAEKQEALGDEPAGIPARELLADMLLHAKKPEQALAEYELDLKFNPNRFNGLYGAGRAAELLGQHEKARQYYKQLLTNCAGSHSVRPELAHATGAMAGR